MRYFTRSLLAAVLAPLAISAVPTRRDADLRADQVPPLASTSTAGGATKTALSSLHDARDSDLYLIPREIIIAPQGAAVSFGQPDANGAVTIDISTPEPTSPTVAQTTTVDSVTPVTVSTSTPSISTPTIPPGPKIPASGPHLN